MNKIEKEVKELIKNYNNELNLCKNKMLERWEKEALKALTQFKNRQFDKIEFYSLYDDLESAISKSIDNSNIHTDIDFITNKLYENLLNLLKQQTKLLLTQIELLLTDGYLKEECISINEKDKKDLLNVKDILQKLLQITNISDIQNFRLPYFYNFFTCEYCSLDNIIYDIKLL